MSTIRETIEVGVPVRTAYNQWTQFEEFPRFMEGVKQVTQLGDAKLRWTAEIAGQTRTWMTRIIEQEPDQRVSWESTEGARNAGSVQFRPSGDGAIVTLALSVEPEGPVEAAGDALGFIERRARGDLERFKTFIEARAQETGGWRGEIARGAVVRDDAGGSAPGRAQTGDAVPDDDAVPDGDAVEATGRRWG